MPGGFKKITGAVGIRWMLCIWAALMVSDGWNWICAFVHRIGLVRHIDNKYYRSTLSEY